MEATSWILRRGRYWKIRNPKSEIRSKFKIQKSKIKNKKSQTMSRLGLSVRSVAAGITKHGIPGQFEMDLFAGIKNAGIVDIHILGQLKNAGEKKRFAGWLRVGDPGGARAKGWRDLTTKDTKNTKK